MTLIEIVAVAFGLMCVWLTIKQNIWCWPTGLVQVSLFIVIFYEAKLYSDLILHVIYVGLQFYGWYYWLYGGENDSVLKITRLQPMILGVWGIVCVFGTLIWGWLMLHYTNAAVPYPDAFTTVTSLVAMWLMAQKRLESWWFWIVVDVVAIQIYLYKALFLTAGLYSVFLVLATFGFFAWRQSLLTTEKADFP